MAFGYSSDWLRFFGVGGPERISQTTIQNHATALLKDLVGLREGTKEVTIEFLGSLIETLIL